ncbi:hypothetical protein D3C73_1042560 [compost metagenome]
MLDVPGGNLHFDQAQLRLVILRLELEHLAVVTFGFDVIFTLGGPIGEGAKIIHRWITQQQGNGLRLMPGVA